MRVTSSIGETRAVCRALRSAQHVTLGLVPTMGALHAGHMSLVRAAKQSCDVVAVSLFVNPTQFGPNEDLAKYPRTFEADRDALNAEGVDLLFAPGPAQMYPTGGLSTYVDAGEVANRLDGLSRPGHFRGVTTVVSKLFNIVQPDRAFFGQKDAAQVAVLRTMVGDLDIPVEMVVCPTVREDDGLALSSRNRFLSTEQRRQALALSQALSCAERAAHAGERTPATLLARMREHLNQPGIRIDYVEAVDADTLLPVEEVRHNTLLAVAAWVGETRLIDNVLLTGLPSGAGE